MSNHKKNFSFVKESYNSIKKGRFPDALVMLERFTKTSGDNEYSLFLLAVSYVFTDKYFELETVFKRIKNINPVYLPLLLLQAFLHLKSSSDFEEALSVYIELLEQFPQNEYIIKIVYKLRSVKNFKDFQKEAKLLDFVFLPFPPNENKIKKKYIFRFNLKKIIFFLMIILLGIGGGLFYKFYGDSFYKGIKKKISTNTRKIENISISGSNYQLINRLNKKSVNHFYYSSSKLITDFKQSKKLIKNSNYNQALKILNRINNSNAGFSVKEKADFLIRFILDVEEREYENIKYTKISKNPEFFRGYGLEWKGKVSNLKVKGGKKYFSLLVDYENGDEISGIADIFSDLSVKLNNGDIVRVSGILMTLIGKEKKPYISAREIEINN